MQAIADGLDDRCWVARQEGCGRRQNVLPSCLNDRKTSAGSHQLLSAKDERGVVSTRNKRHHSRFLHACNRGNHSIDTIAQKRKDVFALQLLILMPCLLESSVQIRPCVPERSG